MLGRAQTPSNKLAAGLVLLEEEVPWMRGCGGLGLGSPRISRGGEQQRRAFRLGSPRIGAATASQLGTGASWRPLLGGQERSLGILVLGK